MLSFYDYGIIAFYLVFILAVGLVFRRMSRDTSDYFRAGGAMPWWLTGISTWIFSFSAWTFTGAAGKVYEAGTLVLVVFYCTVLALVIVFLYTGARFRRMRVITWTEAVRQRYGAGSERFYTWMNVPLRLFFAAISLNAVGVFMSAVFRIEMNAVLIALGGIVTIVAFAGGSWAVLASDFVQAFLVMTITLCTAVLVLIRADIGGLSGLLEKVPTAHFNWTELSRPEFIVLWVLATLWLKITDENSLERSTMYLMTRSDRDARRMVIVPMLGMLIGPLIWFIPSMAATILHPNLAAEFPGLKQPHEAAFVAVSLDVMPNGLLGLLLSAMLGATVTSLDAGLNKNVGICIRSLYRPVFRPQATERHLLVAGKVGTLIFGLIVTAVALLVNYLRDSNLFDLVNQLSANLIAPLGLPLVFATFCKRTPGWSAWSTVLVASVTSWWIGEYVSVAAIHDWTGWNIPLNGQEATYFKLGVTTLIGTVVVGGGWYFFTMLFYRASAPEYRQQVDHFFENLRTPICKADVEGVQSTLYKLLGGLCLVYGGFILLLMLIPNAPIGRLCFLFCGGSIFSAGALLYRVSRRGLGARKSV